MSIVLKPEHEQFIQAKLATGRYTSVDEVISVALKLLDNQEQRLEELQQKIAIGTEQIQNGQVIDGEAVFAELQEKISRLSNDAER